MIYFDNNATTKPAKPVIEAISACVQSSWGNPSSAHSVGRDAKSIVSAAREKTAVLLGASRPDEIFFTSGGTESDNWAILGALEAMPEKRHIVTTRVEHEAVRKTCEKLETRGFRVSWLDVEADGLLSLDQLATELCDDTALVSIMLANNETGVVFPIEEAANIVKSRCGALFHSDGVNAAGKLRIDLKNTAVDLFSISAHKFHGPKGIGALYVKNGVPFPPFITGGGQEKGHRAGTEAVHQIAGIGAAAEFAADIEPLKMVEAMRNRLEEGILSRIPKCRSNGTRKRGMRLPNTANISFENTNGEAILSMLDDLGVCVSTGSACNAENHVSSPVLRAMNIPYSFAMGSIRFSLGRFNTMDEVDFVIEKLPGIIAHLREIGGVQTG